jgi:nicotinamidase-related amidase
MDANLIKQTDKGLLTPENCAVCLIDHQPQMNFGVASIDRDVLLNNTLMLAKAAKVFNVPVILTTVAAEDFSGWMYPQILDVFPGQKVIDRTTVNAWEDKNFRAAVDATGRRNLVMAALWTEICLALPAIHASVDGYNVFVVEDACGGVSPMVHAAAMRRVEGYGAVPVTAMQVLLELQRDWSRQETYDDVMTVLKEHGGAYGQGIEYNATMRMGAAPTRHNPDGVVAKLSSALGR